jgi:hypothetical protein
VPFAVLPFYILWFINIIPHFFIIYQCAPKKVLTSDFTPIYNNNIYRAKVYLLFIIMSAAESKNVYQRCFIVLFVLFLMAMVAQLACLVGLYYLPAAQAALALKVVLTFSIIIDTACVMLSLVAAVYVSSLGTVLCVLFSVLILALIVIACFFSGGKGCGSFGGSSRGGSSGGSSRNSCFCCWLGGGGRSTGSSGDCDCDDCCECQEPGPTILAFVVTFTEFASFAIAIYCLVWHCQWTMVHEHEHDNTPFLITLLLCSVFRTLLAGLMIFFKPFATICWSGPNDEEERKDLLGDASLRTFRTLPTGELPTGELPTGTLPTGKPPTDLPID